ncbi:peptidase S10 [Sphingomonas sp. MG17]|uniref:Peptidase S10 n=2 Tax=Sphingomonas tagetis TaxID=2949092 RepID=A0A9X2HU78_9SPHN|nr:peptidase S10 [Sphingomonas tagetis]
MGKLHDLRELLYEVPQWRMGPGPNGTRGFLKWVALTLLLSAPVQARQAPPAPAAATPVSLSAPIVTEHRGTFNGKKVAYRAFVEQFDAAGLDGAPAAKLVSISYVARNATLDRPVLFVFNGGPIVHSAFLHMGAFGPKRVAIPDDIAADPATFKSVDNRYSILDVADVVFFDPAGTGFSRTAKGIDIRTQFSNVADARQLQQLVLAWTRAHRREGSPYYLVGESYGTIRASEAARQLAESGRPPAGLVLIGQAVNIVEYVQRRGNIVSYAVSLPTLAAIAWHHYRAERRGRSFDRYMQDAHDFAAKAYLTALFAGATAPLDERQAVARRLQEFTGIPADFWLKNALRMTKTDYQRALFPGKLLDTYDARYVSPVGQSSPFSAVSNSYIDALLAYLASDLGVTAKVGSYVREVPTSGLNGWDFGPNKTPFGDWPYGEPITDLFAAQPDFRLLVANGYYDTQTTIGAQNYLVTQSGWPRARVRSYNYQGGHMPYTIEASLAAMMQDVRAMVTRRW